MYRGRGIVSLHRIQSILDLDWQEMLILKLSKIQISLSWKIDCQQILEWKIINCVDVDNSQEYILNWWPKHKLWNKIRNSPRNVNFTLSKLVYNFMSNVCSIVEQFKNQKIVWVSTGHWEHIDLTIQQSVNLALERRINWKPTYFCIWLWEWWWWR